MYSFGLGLVLLMSPYWWNCNEWHSYGTYEGAVAESINTDTAIRLNQYIYLSGEENTRHYRARIHQRQARINRMYRERHR